MWHIAYSSTRQIWSLACALFAAVSLVVSVAPSFAAQSVTDDPFYEGKTLRIIVFTNPGGGYDTYARLLARHFSKYIPGEPTVIVQNMTGAGGLIAVNHVYNRAARDGTVILAPPWQFPISQLVGQPGVRFDVRKMTALGSADLDTNLLFTRKDRFSSLQDLIDSGKKAKLASSGRGDTSHATGKVVEAVVGKELFEYIRGYGSGREIALAVKRGEVDGAGFQLASGIKPYLNDMLQAGELAVLVQAGVSGKPDPELPDVPLVSEIAKTPEAQKIAKRAYTALTFGRGFWLPPEVPEGQVEVLREAFWKVMQDPKLLEEAKKMGRTVHPMRAEEVEEMWQQLLESPPDVVNMYEEIFKTGG